MKMGTNGEGEKTTPTEKPVQPKVPESLFEKLAPMFKQGIPALPSLSPLKVQGYIVDELYASAKDALGLWDGEVVSPDEFETTADIKKM
jgi:hypothetical protein